MDFLILGDQSTETFAAFRHPASFFEPDAQVFLAQVDRAIRREISQLPQSAKNRLPRLPKDSSSLIQDWAERSSLQPVIRPVLTATSQVLDLLSFNAKIRDYPSSKRYILGSCTGLLTGAVATALSPCNRQWMPLAIQAVCIAFRIGIVTASARECLIADEDLQESWSSVVRGEFSSELLAEFHEIEGIPVPKQAYVSAITPNSKTVSGPPRTLKKLFNSTLFRDSGCSAASLPISAPYHAAHLYADEDVGWIVGVDNQDTLKTLSEYCPRDTLISTENGQPFLATDMVLLLTQTVREVLCCVLRWDSVLAGITSLVSPETTITVTTIGSSSLAKGVVDTLRANDEHRVSSTQVMTTPEVRSIANEQHGSKIAIVGMSGRFPGATTLSELWDVLIKGLDVHKPVPADRFDVATHVDREGKRKNTTATPYGCFIDQPGLFDPAFFQMSPREARNTDPMQRLALVCAYEALESSGYVADRTPASMLDRAATFFGQTLDDYREVNAAQDIDPFYVSGCLRPFGPGRINYYYKFTGPSYIVDTACSSSLAAIHIACSSLRTGECDMAVAGGTNIITGSDMYAGLSRGQFLSNTGPCKTFDDEADGYCRADGVATIVLKRLEDAEADRDPILGVILSSATNHSSQATSITQPHGPTQEALFHKVLNQAGIRSSDVHYIEMHGTGTQVGDSTEMNSVSNVFGHRGSSEPIYLGSIKANMGHSEAAAGATSVIKGLLMFQNNMVPAHIGVKGKLNRNFPSLEEQNIYIPHQKLPFPAHQEKKRRILINNFGAAGGNTVLVLEEPPSQVSATEAPERPAYVIAISAKSSASLQENKRRMSTFLAQNDQVQLADLSYTTTSRRPHYRYRFMVSADSTQGLGDALMARQDTAPVSKPKLLLTFTGQGAIYCGVAREIFEISRQFRSDILRFDQLGRDQGLSSFIPLFDPSIDSSSLSPEQMQVGQICIQMGLYRLYRTWGIAPDAVVGHSLGEYAALYAAGVLSASDVILIVGKRAMLTEEHCEVGTHTMLAVRANLEKILQLTRGTSVEVACINGPDDVVLGGPVNAIEDMAQVLSGKDIKLARLPVPYAYHSAQLDPIIEEFEAAVGGCDFNPPKIPILSPLLGEDIDQHGIVNAGYLSRHLRERVDFPAALKNSEVLLAEQETCFFEIGPHPLCAGMVRNVLGTQTIPTLCRGENAWKSVLNSLASLYMRGFDIDWEAHSMDVVTSVSCLACLPPYGFDEKNYWIEYKGNWALSKGNLDAATTPNETSVPKEPATASVQQLIFESLEEKPIAAEFESELMHPDLYEAITGHMVDGAALCPSAIFADMAFTAAKHLYELAIDDFNELDMELVEMNIISPIVLGTMKHSSTKSRRVRISAVMTSEETCYVEISNGGVINSSPTSTLYSKCSVVLRQAAKVKDKWRRHKHLIQSRITHLQSETSINRLNNRIAYKIFGAIVNYSRRFQGMDEIFLDGEHFEAVSKLTFKDNQATEKFFRNPYWLDNLTQLPGFVLNANETVDTSAMAYISNGWESMQLAVPLSGQQVYWVYVKMEVGKASVVSGDVYVLDDAGDIVCVTEGIKFQGVPRTLLKLLLGQPDDSSASEHVPAAQVSGSSSQSSRQPEVFSAATLSKCPSSMDLPGVETSTVTDISVILMQVLCEELGLEYPNLDRTLRFAEMGVDSIMSLTVAGRLREHFNLDFPSTMFQSYPTLDQLVKFLNGSGNPGYSRKPSVSLTLTTNEVGIATHRRSTSVLLQGSLLTSVGNLFLFPGGFGTASSFAPLPPIDPKLAVFGLNSAFLKVPEEFTVSIPEMASLYLAEVRRRQAHGPYSFLGYSVGGVVAYEAARQMILLGETVERLYLVDSPCPLVIPPMPPSLIKFLDSIDRFGAKGPKSQGPSEELVKPMGSLHVTQTLISLEKYVPERLPRQASCPHTTYYVAKQGVSPQTTVPRSDVSANEMKVINWLLDDRTGLGATGDGWEDLLDGAQLKIVPVEGNHFSIMKEPYILEWVQELRSSYWN